MSVKVKASRPFRIFLQRAIPTDHPTDRRDGKTDGRRDGLVGEFHLQQLKKREIVHYLFKKLKIKKLTELTP